MYSITRLTVPYAMEKARTKITCNPVVTGFFEIGDLVEVIDLKKLERTTQIKIQGKGKSAILANSLFTENANKHAVIQEIDPQTAELLTKEAVEYHDNYKKDNYLVMANGKNVLMSVLTDEFIESLKGTEQKKLF